MVDPFRLLPQNRQALFQVSSSIMRMSTQLLLWGLLVGSSHAWTHHTPKPTVPNTPTTALKFQRNKRSALHYVNDKNIETPATRVGEVLLGGKYMLTGYIPVPSLKCDIYKAYPLNEAGQIQGDQPLIVKFSNSNLDLEFVNYQRLWARLTPEQENLFVKIHDRIPGTALPVNEWGVAPPQSPTMSSPDNESSVSTPSHPPGIVMERGYDNLRVFLRKNGAYKGDALRQAFYSIISTVHALHSNNLIWTELKPENFVVTPKGIKGIDLESIVPTNDLLQVYTAEACPPEFPLEEMYVTLPEMAVTEAFDVWGLGLVLYEVATGHSLYAEGMTDLEFIKRQLRNVDRTLLQVRAKLRRNVDQQAACLILACLQANPEDRPSCQQLLASNYFSPTTTSADDSHYFSSTDSKQSTSTHFFQATTGRTATTTTSKKSDVRESTGQRKQKQPSVVHRFSDTIAAKEQLVQKVHRTVRTDDHVLDNKKVESNRGTTKHPSLHKEKASQTITVAAQVRTYVPPQPKTPTSVAESVAVPVTKAAPTADEASSSTTVEVAVSLKPNDHVFKAVESPKQKQDVSSGASSTTVSKEEQRRLDWKHQLTQVLDTLAVHAREDPDMAYDLVSILDRAKEKVLPTPTPTLGY